LLPGGLHCPLSSFVAWWFAFSVWWNAFAWLVVCIVLCCPLLPGLHFLSGGMHFLQVVEKFAWP
jgi:hypothetical protein